MYNINNETNKCNFFNLFLIVKVSYTIVDNDIDIYQYKMKI